LAAILNSLLAWLTQYGYLALFGLLTLGIVGLPIPDETLLVFSGYLIAKGRFHPLFAFLGGFLGSVCGISLSYTLGRTVGHAVVLRYGKRVGLSAQALQVTHRWFAKTGEWLLTFGYFIPGVRHCTALVAGTSGLEFRTFAIFAWAGAAIWVASFLILGYFVGERWQQAVAFVEHYTLLTVVLAVAIAATLLWLRRKLLKTVSQARIP
jgi:membrane protein DedA with SNARE-associated domain